MSMPRILLIDPEVSFRIFFQQVLYELECRICLASNDEAGIVLCEQERPELVAVDLMAPRAGGLGITEMLRLHFPNALLVGFAREVDEGLCLRWLEHGADHVLSKELPAHHLQREMMGLLAGHRHAHAALAV